MDIETPEAGGVIFSQGSRFGGHALYVRDGKLKYVYNFVGELVQIVESEDTIPPVTSCSGLLREAGRLDAHPGAPTLHIRDKTVGEADITTQLGKFGLGGGGLIVGRSGAEPVIDDYVGDAARSSSAERSSES